MARGLTLQEVSDRFELEDVLYQYYDAVDSCTDYDKLIAAFTEDAVFDVSDLGLKSHRRHEQIRAFFAGIFQGAEYHAHHITNFHVTTLERDRAQARAYIYSKAKVHNSELATLHCSVDIDFLRTADVWKICKFDEDFIVPMGQKVAQMHTVG